ncbi:hypothetical protein OU798_01540 [Prolixibacteraceae bacterium Z1-6]|uniref:SnoaL-like domain-containing protein n=1 Tax=Draconibacterium aestuarii TaxID=2998507 RepID=A0A9X3F214_9BACT|nr:hypothetical protein [Prolixibacteraceae bacterium Z1-6]
MKERVEKLNNLISHGHILEAFEKFYAEDMTKQVDQKPLLVGKAACRSSEECFVTSITTFRSAYIKNTIISGNVSITEWEFDLTHEKWGDKKFSQIAIQRWNPDGEIINETIYINNL